MTAEFGNLKLVNKKRKKKAKQKENAQTVRTERTNYTYQKFISLENRFFSGLR